MPALWVLAVVALLLTLFLLMPLRILLSAHNGEVRAEARAGFLKIRLYPPPEEKPRKAKASKPKAKKKKPAPERGAVKSAERVLKTVRRLWEPVTGVLRKVRGAVRIDPLEIHVAYAGRDEPADAAILCGDTLALVWAVMPVVEEVCRVPRPCITANVNFDASALDIQADVGLTLRVWAALASLTPLLSLLRRERKQAASGEAGRAVET